MGRPTDNPKETSIHVRLDAECVEVLEKYCEQENIGRAEATRQGIICEQEQVTKAEAARRGIKKLKDDLKK